MCEGEGEGEGEGDGDGRCCAKIGVVRGSVLWGVLHLLNLLNLLNLLDILNLINLLDLLADCSALLDAGSVARLAHDAARDGAVAI